MQNKWCWVYNLQYSWYFYIFVTSWSTETLIETNLWLRPYLTYILEWYESRYIKNNDNAILQRQKYREKIYDLGEKPYMT